MIDTYTKIVLTVIAISLATIATKGTFVQVAMSKKPNPLSGSECGKRSINPCYVAIKEDVPIVNGGGGLLGKPLKVKMQ